MEGFKYAAETAAAEHLKIAPTGTAHIALVKDGGGDQDKGLVVSHGDGGGGGNVLTATTAAAAGGGTDGPAATAAAALLRGGFLAAATAGDGPLIPRAHTLQPPMWCVGDAGRLHTGSLCPLSPKGDTASEGEVPVGQPGEAHAMTPLGVVVNVGNWGLLNSGEWCIISKVLSRLVAEQGRTSRGDSGALYLQPATAGMNPGPRTRAVSSDLHKQR